MPAPTTPFSRLQPFDKKKKEWRVVIETPKDSHNKYKYDEDLGLFLLGGVLPQGMAFPYDFGFIPGTLAEDGDPIDVLLLMDFSAYPGCVVAGRMIGVIEAQQTEKDGKTTRNDRLVAVPTESRLYGHLKNVKEIGEGRLGEIKAFFITYNQTRGKKFKVLEVRGPGRAERLAKDAIAAFGKKGGK
jgi:inorganic pyrophosphatase